MLIPLKVDVPRWRTPWVNYALIALIVGISIAAFYDQDLFCALAGIELRWTLEGVSGSLTTEDYPLPVLAVSSSLLHAGWLHLIGNMLFLWIFGNAVNYKFGPLGYLGIYLASAMAGGLAHYGLDGGPVVGASGAINGVMAAFLVFFPRNDVKVLWLFPLPAMGLICPRVWTISSGWIIFLWIVWDVFYLALGAAHGVALWGHLGGFAAGFVIACICASLRWIKPTPDEQTLLEVLGGRR